MTAMAKCRPRISSELPNHPLGDKRFTSTAKTSGGAFVSICTCTTPTSCSTSSAGQNRFYSTGFTKVSGAIDHVLTQYEVECGAKVSAEGSWAMTPGWGF